jgi:hypothetical protein
MKFLYLRDPLFLVCFAVYWCNRLAEHFGYGWQLTRSYLNDTILIPFFVPVMLWLLRRLAIRDHDGPPNLPEVVIPAFVVAVAFEIVLPLTDTWQHLTVADPYDVSCYLNGGIISWILWRRYYLPAPGNNTSAVDA